MRQSESKFIHGEELRDIFPELFTKLLQRSYYPQSVELVWTDGKADKLWTNASGTALADAGFLESASINDNAQVLTAKIVLDLSLLSTSNVGSLSLMRTQIKSSMTLNEVKQKCFMFVCHEYIHALQKWQEPLNLKPRYNSIYLSLISQAKREGIEKPDDYAYNNHPYEKEAFRLAAEAVNKYRLAINNNEYDYMFPLDWIKTMLKNQAGG